MSYKLYIGNIPFTTDEDQLKEMFAEFGEVSLAKIVRNSYNNKSKGYGFIEMEKQQDANNVIAALNGKDMGGRELTVEKGKRQIQGPKYDKKRPMVQSHTMA
ncbi:MAG: hypothetical protein KAG61_07475 [Bacteriovoracaceae bacterium]|nr:hypothetical protein [Bacteriovoracaceae bacterium]